MLCPICKVDPCICGDKFVNLTDRGLLNLIASLCEIAKGRNIGINCTVNDEPISDFINQSKNIPIGTLRSVINSNLDESPELAEFLDKHQGETVLSLYNRLTEADEKISAFPMLVFILACTGNYTQLKAILLSIYRDIFEANELDKLLFQSQIHSSMIGTALSMAINREMGELVQIIKSPEAPQNLKTNLTKLTSLLNLIGSTESSTSLNVLLTKAIMCFTTFSPKEDMDELKNADYWLCRFFKDRNIDFKGMLV